MTTKLDGELKRELNIAGAAYTLIISPLGLKLTEKGRRKGIECWRSPEMTILEPCCSEFGDR